MVKLLTKDTSGASRSVLNRTDSEKLKTENLTVPGPLVKDLVKLCKLLSDETRLKILYYLTQKDELHVRALCDLLGESQPAVSHHLALLRVAGLIERRREGKHNFYGLQTQRFTALLDMLFATMPEGNRRIRFEDYVLGHAPARQPEE